MSILRWLRSVPKTVRTPWRNPALRKGYNRLFLETLEDRTLLSTSFPLSSQNFTALGPADLQNVDSGRIAALAADRTDPNTIFIAAAGGGVWKTTNGGANWTSLTDTQSTLSMGAIAIAPSNNQIVYAGTGEANNSGDSFPGKGILKSTDGGASWNLLGSGVVSNTTAKIVIDPTSPDIVYAAGDSGVFKSTDGGTSWADTISGDFSDLIIDPTNRSILYAAEGAPFGGATGVFKTLDGGATWTQLTLNLPVQAEVGRITLAISQSSSPQTIYCSISDTGATDPKKFGNLYGFLFSVNGGTNWTNEAANLPNYMDGQGWYDTTLAVDPNTSTVYAGGSSNGGMPGIIASTTRGTTWTSIDTGPHTDQHGIGFDANGKLLVGTDGGIWRLESLSAKNWTDLNGNLNTIQFTGISLDPTNLNLVYGGSQDNGTEKFNDNQVWNVIVGGDGGFTQLDHGHPSTIFQTRNYTLPATGFIQISTDGGATFKPADTGIGDSTDPANFYPPYVIDPSNSQRLLLGTDKLYETLNQGAMWKQVGKTVFPVIDAIGIAPTDPNTIYLSGSDGGVYETFDHGVSWSVSFGVGGGDIKVDPTNSQIVYSATFSGSVFATTNGGTSWNFVSSQIPSPVTSLVVDPATRGVYAGTADRGVFLSDDFAANWAPVGSGLPNARVVNLDLIKAELQPNGVGYALGVATHGRGAWEISTVHLAVSAPSSVAAGSPFDITVSALDPLGNPDPGFIGTVHLTTTDPQGGLPADYAFTTQDAGVHTFKGLTTLKTAGSQTITTSDTPDEIDSGKAAVIVNALAATQLFISAPTTTTAGTPFTVTVSAFDPYGNVDSAFAGTIHFTSSDKNAVLPLDYTFVAGDSGVHAFLAGATLKTAGLQTITATEVGNSAITGTASITVIAALATHLGIIAPSTAAAGVAFSITVSALDPYGNADSTYRGTVHFTTSANDGSLPANYTFQASDGGTHTFSNGVILTNAGAQTLTATDTITSSLTGSTTVLVTAGAATHYFLSGPFQVTAGTPFGFTVAVFDQFNNTVTSYVGTVHFTSTDPQAVLPKNYTFTATDAGMHTFAAVLKTAPNGHITATDTVTSSIAGIVSVIVNAAAASRLVVTAPASGVAGTPFSLTVTLFDRFNNTASGYRGTVTFTTSDGSATLPASYMFQAGDRGVHTFANGATLRKAGSQTVTATDTVTSSLTSTATVTVNPGAAASLTVVPSVAQSVAGQPFNLVVTAFDQFSNLATGYLGTVKFTSSDASFNMGNYTFTAGDQGAHTFTGLVLKKAGKQTVTVTDTSTSSVKGTGSVTVLAAGANHFLLMASTANPKAGVQFQITVFALDPFNNKVARYAGTVAFSDSVSGNTLPANYTFTNVDAGKHVFNVTLTTPGSQTITVKDTAHPGITGSVTVTVQTGADLILSGPPINTGSSGATESDLDLFFALTKWWKTDAGGFGGIWS